MREWLLSWYKATVPHDRIGRGQVVWLEDTAYVLMKLDRGYLEPADEPEWNRQAPVEKRWPRED